MKSLRMCNRVAKSKGITDDEGRIYLSYRVPLNTDEDPNDLCQCIRSFVLQGDWWLGVKHFCYVECDTVTLMLIGTPDKEFIDAVPVYQDKDPIDVLSQFYGIYSNTQVWKDNCSAKPGVSQDGLKNIVWTCEYSGSNLPPPDVLCDYMITSINGSFDNSLLNKSVTHSCTVKGEKFYFNLVANDKSLKQLILTLIS
ncbi:uncharacterized protein LOC119080792 [Bradysia coprophila]|uniref:uncharacterized protein LOC119080792 n=1 Tax=Bradysia coprophila TaxID=38358 RepID=UPI00187DD555|nr:uncharacterized protein LOC119080792 [Bradysia coprophila]